MTKKRKKKLERNLNKGMTLKFFFFILLCMLCEKTAAINNFYLNLKKNKLGKMKHFYENNFLFYLSLIVYLRCKFDFSPEISSMCNNLLKQKFPLYSRKRNICTLDEYSSILKSTPIRLQDLLHINFQDYHET